MAMTSEQFVAWRIRHKLTQPQVATLIELSSSHVLHLEQGIKNIRHQIAYLCESVDLLKQSTAPERERIFAIAPSFKTLWNRLESFPPPKFFGKRTCPSTLSYVQAP